jgi:hypothetical protein
MSGDGDTAPTPPKVGANEVQAESIHGPRVMSYHTGWIVVCPDCLARPAAEVPIGIGIPLESRETAERIRDNHIALGRRRQAREPDRKGRGRRQTADSED